MKSYILAGTGVPVVFGKRYVIAEDPKGVHVNYEGVGYLIEGKFADVVAELEGETVEAPAAATEGAPAAAEGGSGQ